MRGYLLVFIGVLCFATSLPFTQWAVAGLDPFSAGVGRATIGAIFSLITLLILRPPLPKGAQWRHLAYVGVGTGFIFPGSTALSTVTVPANEGAIVIAILPLVTAVAAYFIERDRKLGGWFWLSSLLASLVVAAFILRDGFSGFAVGHLWLLVSLLTGFSYAWAGRTARSLPGWQVICWSLVLALPFQLLCFAILWPTLDWAAPPQAWIALLLGVLGAQWGGFFAFFAGLALVGSARGSMVQYSQPFLTLVIVALLPPLSAIDWRLIPYATLVVAALLLSRFDRTKS